MAISAASVTSKVVKIKSPNGTFSDVDSVVYTAATGQATFRFSRSFTSSDNGIWEVYTSDTDKVLDAAGNAVAGNTKLGSFTVNIPAPSGDSVPPTVTLVSISPTSITTAGNVEISIVVTFADT
jgi:hypothetical protein